MLVRALRILAGATIRGQHLFARSSNVQLLFEGGV